MGPAPAPPPPTASVSWLALLGGLVVGFALAAWLQAWRGRRMAQRAAAAGHELARRLAVAEARAGQAEVGRDEARAQLAGQAPVLADLRGRLEAALCELAEAREGRRAAAEHAAAQVAALTEVRQSFADHFRALSQEVLAEKAALFDRQQRAGLQQLVEPLHRELLSFRQRVDEVWRREGEERAGLGERLAQISELAQGLGVEARSLSQALRGDHRALGDWGEMVLERLLGACGLRVGVDFEVQKTFEDGARRARPDVVVHLPHQREVLIDAKVSLTDYYDRVQAGNDQDAHAAAVRLAQALRAHIRTLANKDYPHLAGVNSLDCTLLFVPIEPAFLCALETDPGLWEHAWSKKIVLVCPTTLLCVLRIVEDQWRQARQSQHAQDIAHRGAKLYDKFVGMMADFEQLGQRMEQAHAAYQGVRSKISTGQGNLVAQFEMLRRTGGLKSSKRLSAALVDGAEATAVGDDGGGVGAPAGAVADEAAQPSAARP